MIISCERCKEEKKHHAKGFCKKCYPRQYQDAKKMASWNKICTVCGITYFNKSLGSRAKYCKPCAFEVQKINHRNRLRIKKGIPLDRPVKTKKKDGEGYISPQGYKLITVRGHPNSKNKQGRIAEHIVIMANHIGRPLKDGESVHHKNGIRNDNRIENLELWHRGQPAGQRVEDKINWAIEFLKEYGYEMKKS